MDKRIYKLWNDTPGFCEEEPIVEYYKPQIKATDMAIVIFPGGGYYCRSAHEGDAYARFLAGIGITAFVVQYRVNPHIFPLPLLDARRGVRFARYHAEEFGIDKNKIAVMGSSAGGHLAALVSTYSKSVDIGEADAIDKESFLPNAQILCYPVINLYDKNITHIDSGNNLIGINGDELNGREIRKELSPSMHVSEITPQAFIWHTFQDDDVNVCNSLEYAEQLRKYSIPAELHIFPFGEHGMGLTNGKAKDEKHVSVWADLLINWLKYIDWFRQ